MFNLQYNKPRTYSLYNDTIQSDQPAFDLSQTMYLSPTHLNHPLQKATVIDIPFTQGEPYKLQLCADSSIVEVNQHNILQHDPSATSDSWFKHKAKCTLFLPESMAVPKHGIITLEDNM